MIWSIYVSKSAQKNFDIGLKNNVWGAKSDSFSEANIGDTVVFVFGLSWRDSKPIPRGFPRLKAKNIEDFRGVINQIVVVKITSKFDDFENNVWLDDIYPYRFSFDLVSESEANIPFGLKHNNESFVHSVRNSLLSKGAISKVNVKEFSEIYNSSVTERNDFLGSDGELSSDGVLSTDSELHSGDVSDERADNDEETDNDKVPDDTSYRFPLENSMNIRKKSEISPALGVKEVSETLASVIINQPDDSGMMVGIFGKWGRGKTFLADRTWQSMKSSKPLFQRVVFSAWKYQDTKSSWAYLYKSLLEQYLKNDETVGYWSKIKSPFIKYKKLFLLNKKNTV